MPRIYLDHAATSPLSATAEEAMLPWLDCGNPSSLYLEGRKAKDAIDAARETLSDALGCLFAEVLFASGGTEAANLAIVGAALQNEDSRRNRVLLGASEHHCVLYARPWLERLGYRVELIPVDRYARVDLAALEAMLGDDVLLASVMHANNELGTINPIRQIADLVHANGALFHCDAVQTFLAIEPRWSVADLNADMATVSAHKVNGPKGAGAIYLRAGVKLKPIVVGGGQEREMRAGTENVAAIAGFAAAVRERIGGVKDGRRTARRAFLSALGEGFERTVPENVPTLDGHLHLRAPGIQAETLLILLDRMGVSASSGAACSSGSIEPSHVLLACGYDETQAKEGLRFSFGNSTSAAEAREGARLLAEAVAKMRLAMA